MIKQIAILLMILFTQPLFAQDSNISETGANEIDCKQLKNQIKMQLAKPATCWSDAECQTISWGCPWQYAPCHVSIYSTSEQDKNTELSQKISTYSKICVASDEKISQNCQEFNQQVTEKQCQVRLPLFCLQGKCATHIDSILQRSNVDSIHPADIYGSREVIKYNDDEE